MGYDHALTFFPNVLLCFAISVSVFRKDREMRVCKGPGEQVYLMTREGYSQYLPM